MLNSITAVLMIAAWSAIPGGQTNATGQTNSMAGNGTSATFIRHAAEGGQAEVTLATMAESKASRDDVKALARKIREDHEKANAELKTLASSKNVTLPTTDTAEEKALEARLSKLSGAAFDRAYVDAMVTDHKKDVAEFKMQENNSDRDVAGFAQKTRPTLEDHLSRAETVQRAIKGGGF